MAENRNAQQVREITDKLEQGIKELFESERFKEYLKTMSKSHNHCFTITLPPPQEDGAGVLPVGPHGGGATSTAM